MKKYFFVLGFPNPFIGAAWTRVSFFGNALSAKGCDVAILGAVTPSTLSKRGHKKIGNLELFNIILRTEVNNPLFFIQGVLTSLFASILLIFLREPDAVIVSMPPGESGIGAIMACRLMRTKYFIDYRDEWEDFALTCNNDGIDRKFFNFVKKVTRHLYADSQLIMTVTPNCSGSLQRRGLTNVQVVWNGADVKVFKPLTRKTKKEAGSVFQIFYSGGIGTYYRLDVVLKSLKLLIDKGLTNIQLVVAGSGAVNDILVLSSAMGVQKKVIYKGAIDNKEDLAALIAESDVGLIPFDDNPLWKNALPAKFFEYCACGLPVIATVYKDSILSKIITDNDIGLVSPPLDVIALSEAIRALYENDVYRMEAGARARSLILERFNRAKLSEDFLEIVVDNL